MSSPANVPAAKSFLEFFAGIGLISEALQRSNWQCVYANDIEPKKAAMYREHFGNAAYYHVGDVWDTPQVLADIGEESPLLATASFPCTDMSLAGNMQGFQGTESSAFFGFANVLAELGERRPAIVLLENVSGFLTSNQGADFLAAANKLAELGYWLDAFVVDAKWFLPQSRPRLFILGVCADLVQNVGETMPDLLIQGDAFMNDPWRQEIETRTTLRPERLRRLMVESELATGWMARRLSVPTQTLYDLSDFLDADDEQAWWDIEQVQRHRAMFNAAHLKRIEDWQTTGETHVATAFRRIREGEQRCEIRFDGVAGCLRTPKGGSARQIVVATVGGELKMRWMTPREYARLQGSPEFAITTSDNQALFGFGDAVCVPVIEWIDEQLLSPFAEVALAAK